MVQNAFGAMGFSAEAATLLEFPVTMFDPGSDLTPLKENIDKVVEGLTQWQPAVKTKGISPPPPMVKVRGRDYADAVAQMNLLFLKNRWGDGLPIVPPTKARVNWILRGTDLPRDNIVGKILPRGGIATVEGMAVCLAMAGGRPEHLPVLLAAVEAMIVPKQRHFHLNSTTNSCLPVVVVNGPVARQIRLNSGYGCLGPSAEYPAGAAIGRALRLVMLTVGGGVPGQGSMSLYGGPGRYANVVFAEDEAGLPPGWKSISADFGYSRGKNTVVFHNVSGTTNINGTSVGDEASALKALNLIAAFMRVPNHNCYFLDTYDGCPGIVLVSRNTAAGLVHAGWSKEKIREYLWENSKIPWSEVKKLGYEKEARASGIPEGEPLPLTRKPENLILGVAGGMQAQHSYWMQMGVSGWPTSAEIRRPENTRWNELLKEAINDLGPVPEK